MSMAVAEPSRSVTESAGGLNLFFTKLAGLPQFVLGLLPRSSARVALPLLSQASNDVVGVALFVRSCIACVLGLVVFGIINALMIALLVAWAKTFPNFLQQLASWGVIASDSGWLNLVPAPGKLQLNIAMALTYATGFFVKAPFDRFALPCQVLRGMLWLRELVARLVGMLFLLGFGLLPLASLLMFLPIIMPEEAVLKDTMAAARSGWLRFWRRLMAVCAGTIMLIALAAFATQVVSWLGVKSTIFDELARKLLPEAVQDRLPPAMVNAWPFVMLLMYATDFLILFAIGKVPLQYNFRNLRVRWVTTMMTGVAFTVVVFLLVLMMSFVDSVNRLTSSSGIKGNVFVLSEGATDELFSNLSHGDVGNLELEKATTLPDGSVMANPITVATMPGKAGQPPLRLCSKETYFVINQEVRDANGTPNGRRRFVQLRGIDDAEVASKVHDVPLLSGEWFGREGSMTLADGSKRTPCVLGQGAAAAWGEDYGKATLEVGDKFDLGDLQMVVVGIMKSAGKTFDSETWATNARVSNEFGKQSFTTVVIRIATTNQDIERSADIFAYHLTKNFTTPRVRAVAEPRYYQDLAKSNSQMMTMVVVVAIIMALGGVIGVMLVMFAAIAQRIKDIGVMRVVGYKRWQILVSFMLESLAIALLGGLVGVIAVLAFDAVMNVVGDGISVTGNVTSGQGGGRSVVTKLHFGTDIVFSGILFTIVMGRLGGLLPSVSAMRLGILESLR